MFSKLNAELLFPLMTLESSIEIPCNEELEHRWGELKLKGSVANKHIEVMVLGCCEYFPMSISGIDEALKWAEKHVNDFKSEI